VISIATIEFGYQFYSDLLFRLFHGVLFVFSQVFTLRSIFHSVNDFDEEGYRLILRQ